MKPWRGLSKNICKALVRNFATVLTDLPITEVKLVKTSHQRIEDCRSDWVTKSSFPDVQLNTCPSKSKTAISVSFRSAYYAILSEMLLGYGHASIDAA